MNLLLNRAFIAILLILNRYSPESINRVETYSQFNMTRMTFLKMPKHSIFLLQTTTYKAMNIADLCHSLLEVVQPPCCELYQLRKGNRFLGFSPIFK